MTEGPARILVVEDSFLVATEIEIALSNAGFHIAGVAASADEAVALAESQKPALAVMDVTLAGDSDGIEAAIEIFQRFGIRSIFATAPTNIRFGAPGRRCLLAGCSSPIPWFRW